MNTTTTTVTTTRTFVRPRHAFDLPALTVLALAGIGRTALAAAHTLDRAVARRQARWRARMADPPVRRTERRDPAEYGVTDAWRVR